MQIEEAIRDNTGQVSPDPLTRREQRGECEVLANKLAIVGQKLDVLEQLGSNLIQSGGLKRRSIESDAERGDPLTKITKRLFELHRREEDAQRSLAELNSRINLFDATSQVNYQFFPNFYGKLRLGFPSWMPSSDGWIRKMIG